METVDLDPTDEEILALLNENARTPDEELAEQVGVSAAEVSERIERLQEEGVITRFTTMFDTSKLGYVSVAFGFSVEPGKADEIANLLSQYDNIYKLWILSGRHNIIAHANFRDITEFQEFSSETLHDIDGIANYETSIATKSVLNDGSALPVSESGE
jgi:Lrp/AsnC family leucine-responsive transcriptional regulator